MLYDLTREARLTMNIFIVLAVAFITLAEGEELSPEVNDDATIAILPIPESPNLAVNPEDEGSIENDIADNEVAPESRHHNHFGWRPPPPQFLVAPNPYPHPPSNYYSNPYLPPYNFHPIRPTGNPFRPSSPPTYTTFSSSAAPAAIIEDNIVSTTSRPMEMTVGRNNLTLDQITCLLDFFLNPSEGSAIENCIGNGILNNSRENSSDDSDDSVDSNSSDDSDDSVDSNSSDDSDDSDDSSDSDENVSSTTERPVVITSTTSAAPNIEKIPGNGLLISFPQVSVVGGNPQPSNDLITNFVGGLNTLLGSIVSSVNRPPANFNDYYYNQPINGK